MLERSTGDSRNDVGVSPGGMVRQGDLEIGSFAGDMSLYLAPPPPERKAEKSAGGGSSSPEEGGGHSGAAESIG